MCGIAGFVTLEPDGSRGARAVLFPHNVETTIWEGRAEHASNALERAYFRLQARRRFASERSVCRAVRRVLAVSDIDAQRMRSMFGADDAVPERSRWMRVSSPFRVFVVMMAADLCAAAILFVPARSSGSRPKPAPRQAVVKLLAVA